ncbi:MAG TPA: GNAT family N-acetyltransferase [Verrucomicrobiae bacterium]
MLVLPEERPGSIPGCAASETPVAASPVTEVNPLQVAGWDDLVSDFASATPFHTTGWLKVLRSTYGHTPRYLCQFSGQRLQACLPVAEVHSPLTGRRGVSLPFTDDCPALMAGNEAGPALWDAVLRLGRARRWKYVECRSTSIAPSGTAPSLEFYRHILDLRLGEQRLLAQLDSSVRRALRKSQSSGLKVELSGEPSAVADYYRLHCLTRQRHGLPPQPWRFFENIGRHLVATGQGMVVIARHEGRAVASALFLHFGEQAIYKYGASDLAAQPLRPNNLVMWEAIRYYTARECRTFDFGRTSLANEGLRRFKHGFGAREEKLAYFRYDLLQERFVAGQDRADTVFNAFFRRLPLPALQLAGRLLYPHLS